MKIRKNLIVSVKCGVIFLLILFSYSNLIITAFFYNNSLSNNTKDYEAHIIGWISKNLPYSPNILILNSYTLNHGLRKIGGAQTFIIEDIALRIDELSMNRTNEEKINLFLTELQNLKIKYSVFHQNQYYYYFYTDFIHDYIIPNFYNISLYSYKDLEVLTTTQLQ